jgi:hypothetical protein
LLRRGGPMNVWVVGRDIMLIEELPRERAGRVRQRRRAGGGEIRSEDEDMKIFIFLSLYSARTRGGREGDGMVGCWGLKQLLGWVSLWLSAGLKLFWYLCFYVRKLNGAPLPEGKRGLAPFYEAQAGANLARDLALTIIFVGSRKGHMRNFRIMRGSTICTTF